jgi:hypothetical protein
LAGRVRGVIFAPGAGANERNLGEPGCRWWNLDFVTPLLVIYLPGWRP